MFEIKGLDHLSRQLEDAQKALGALDGELGTIHFDPHDPASIEVAIQQIHSIVDARLGEYASNPIVGPLAAQMKEKYRAGIIERAAAARLAGDGN